MERVKGRERLSRQTMTKKFVAKKAAPKRAAAMKKRPIKAKGKPNPKASFKAKPKDKPKDRPKDRKARPKDDDEIKIESEIVIDGDGNVQKPENKAAAATVGGGKKDKGRWQWKVYMKARRARKARKNESPESKKKRNEEELQATLFLRNVPLNATEEDLVEEFSKFGELRYAKLVTDKDTKLSKGTAFLCFKEREAAERMMEEAYPPYWDAGDRKDSCLTLMGRQLGVSWAIKREEAEQIAKKTGAEKRKEKKKQDKRNIALAGIGYEMTKEQMEAAGFSSLDVQRRIAAKAEKTAKLRNPNMFVSRTRLTVRYLPHGVDEKMLKMVARQAAIAGLQHPHRRDEDDSDEESDTDEEEEEEEEIKKGEKKPRVVIKQVKIVKEKERMDRKTGKAKLKNFGFVEFETHEMSLAAQQLMNNRADLFVPFLEEKYSDGSSEASFKSRILVDFAVENVFALAKLKFVHTRSHDRTDNMHITLLLLVNSQTNHRAWQASAEARTRSKGRGSSEQAGSQEGENKGRGSTDDAQGKKVRKSAQLQSESAPQAPCSCSQGNRGAEQEDEEVMRTGSHTPHRTSARTSKESTKEIKKQIQRSD